MSNVDYGPLNVALRVHETELLDDNFYRQLLTAESIDQALKLLQGTPYGFIQDASNIDQELRDYVAQIFREAFEMAPDKTVIEFASLDYTYHNLKVLFKNYYSDRQLENLLLNVGRYAHDELNKAVRTGQSTELPEEYLYVIQEVRDYFETYYNLNHLDVILDYYYLDHLYDLAQKIGHPLIIDMIQEYIDLNNMIIAIRLSNLNKPVSSLAGMVPDLGRIPTEQYVKASKDGLTGLTNMLLASPYQELVASLLDKENHVDPIQLEKVLDDHRMQKLKSAKFESFGPLPVIAYLYAKETEVKNLRLILSGLLNDLPKESIAAALRLNYR